MKRPGLAIRMSALTGTPERLAPPAPPTYGMEPPAGTTGSVPLYEPTMLFAASYAIHSTCTPSIAFGPGLLMKATMRKTGASLSALVQNQSIRAVGLGFGFEAALGEPVAGAEVVLAGWGAHDVHPTAKNRHARSTAVFNRIVSPSRDPSV